MPALSNPRNDATQSALSRREPRKPDYRVGDAPIHARLIRSGALAAVTMGQMPNIGPLEIAIVLIIALVVFGPKRLPELGKSLGKGIREFRGSVSGESHDERAHAGGRVEPPQAPASHREPAEAEGAEEGETVAPRPRLRLADGPRSGGLPRGPTHASSSTSTSCARASSSAWSSSASPWRSASGRTTCCSKSPPGRCPATTRSCSPSASPSPSRRPSPSPPTGR